MPMLTYNRRSVLHASRLDDVESTLYFALGLSLIAVKNVL